MPDVEYTLDDMTFSWNEIKAEINKKKHGVSFQEAASAFGDVNAQFYDDEEHSEDEERFILLGYSEMSRMLMICHCYRGIDANIVRIISARNATRQERQKYEERG